MNDMWSDHDLLTMLQCFRNLRPGHDTASCSAKLSGLRRESYVKPAIAKICNMEPGDLVPQGTVS